MREITLMNMKDADIMVAEAEIARPYDSIPSTKEHNVDIQCRISKEGLYAVNAVIGKPQNVVNFVCELTKTSKTKLGNVYWYDNFMRNTGYECRVFQDIDKALEEILPAQSISDVKHILNTHHNEIAE